MRNTKIVATLGPASDANGVLRDLFDSGVDVFRLNLSHGTHPEHAARIANIRKISAERNGHTGILLDLQGPKIRFGTFEGGSCTLTTGAHFTITTLPVVGNCERASTTYPAFAHDVKPGDHVLLADGAAELRVLESDGVEATCEVLEGGLIGDHKGINLPGVAVSSPSLTEKDEADLRFGIEQGVDYVALSFVRKREDLCRLRALLNESNAQAAVISKIEKPEGWQNLADILEESDGVMVARGDLGVEMALEKVPLIQKTIIERARERGKFVITATQMLESMINSPVPTRAEVSDVANAICDGTDAVMLSEETSAGKFPVEAARMMTRIAVETEATMRPRPLADQSSCYREIVADAAFHAADTAGVCAIAVFTSTGSTARLISRFRPRVPVYAFTTSPCTARQMAVSYAVFPIVVPAVQSIDEMLAQVDRVLLESSRLRPGDGLVFVAGQPIGRPGTTNMMKLHRMGSLD